MDTISIALPQNLENMSLPAPELVNYYKDLENRIFWVDGEIDITLMELVRYITDWNREDQNLPKESRKPIKLLFFSPGGELDTYRALADVIKLSITPIIGIVVGTAYSAAGMIYLACHQKYMLKSSSILFHKGSSTMSGTFNEVYAAMVEYQEQIAELAEVICANSTYTKEEVEERLNSDWYIRPQEAIEHGICDKIVTNISDLY